MSIENWIASFGVGILLIGFFLNVFGYLDSKSKPYSILNALGGIISCYASWLAEFYPFVVLNSIWSTTAIISLLKSNVSRETTFEKD
ncbi:hypothetical protein A5893_10960 [Pedobacter psychrophilus]|uniref:CBU-0592-like domain-containing protein n=1 Tax=Pedobacter psychrophilus TaxID=1826909 RepID=A0A179DDY7_9SPHI|nr:hypothetical protein [Pedobacter psychrophilus]OAQ39178.1 hypothetical protein A5893_10960 [Pedobacter psychrophilus]